MEKEKTNFKERVDACEWYAAKINKKPIEFDDYDANCAHVASEYLKEKQNELGLEYIKFISNKYQDFYKKAKETDSAIDAAIAIALHELKQEIYNNAILSNSLHQGQNQGQYVLDENLNKP